MKNNTPRFLVTTPLLATWQMDKPTLFLGEWCKSYANKSIWSEMDAVVVPYHWSDREKLRADYMYLGDLYERLLARLITYLNQCHGTSHSEKYWRILIGPWLAYFTQSVFDKWESVRQAISQFEISGAIKLDLSNADLVPHSMGELFSNYLFNHYWNHYIFSEVISAFTNIRQIESTNSIEHTKDRTLERAERRMSMRSRVRSIYNTVSGYLAHDDNLFFISTYLPLKKDIAIQLRKLQFPKLWSSIVPKWETRKGNRVGMDIEFDGSNDFEQFLSSIITQQLPVLYLEGYRELVNATKVNGWPNRPKVIFTSNALWHDDVSMAYIGAMVDGGAKLIYGQHGGFGIQAYSWAEKHERKIADRYLTWGWTEQEASNLVPVGVLKQVSNYTTRRKIEKKTLLLVRSLSAPYAFRIDSDIGLPQLIQNIERCFRFAESLPAKIRENNLLVRLYPLTRAFSSGGKGAIESSEDFYSEKVRWNEKIPEVEVNDGQDKIADHVKSSKLVVYTYNAGTGYLEFMAANIPVIMFWDIDNSPVRDSAVPYFKKLRAAKIFHDSPESAAQHAKEVWDDVESWWHSDQVQSARRDYVATYCKVNKSITRDICKELEFTLYE